MKFTPIALSMVLTVLLSSCLDDLTSVVPEPDTDPIIRTQPILTDTNTETQICDNIDAQVYFTSSVIGNYVQFDASSSYTFNCMGSAPFESYIWDFGDGTHVKSNSPTITHQYQLVGEYLVTLSDNNTLVYSSYININDDCDMAHLFSSNSDCTQTTTNISTSTNTDTNTTTSTNTYTTTSTDTNTETDPKVCIALASGASFKVNIVNNLASLDASDSYFFENCAYSEITSYEWDFGDGNLIQTQTPYVSHFYENWVSAPITLTIKNDYYSLSTSYSVDFEHINYCFENMDQHFDENTNVVVFAAIPMQGCDDQRTQYKWDLGDGEVSTQRKFEHVYSEVGIYPVRLNVKIGDFVLQRDFIVNIKEIVVDCSIEPDNTVPPTAYFNFEVNGAVVNFHDNNSTDAHPCDESLTYSWAFGDGTSSITDTAEISHTYSVNSNYSVLVIVENAQGLRNSFIMTVPITDVCDNLQHEDYLYPVPSSCITPPEPYVININPIIANSDMVTFSINIPEFDNDQLIYEWAISDGYYSSESIFEYTFPQKGTYVIYATVYGPQGFELQLETTYEVQTTYCEYAPIAQIPAPSIESLSIVGKVVTVTANNHASSCHTGEYMLFQFSDGTLNVVSTVENFQASTTHTFEDYGQYWLTISNLHGETYIPIIIEEPIGCFESYNSQFTVAMLSEKTFIFDASKANQCLTNYSWDFGDGNTLQTTDSVVEYQYDQLGQYVVTLSINDEGGFAAKVIAGSQAPEKIMTMTYRYVLNNSILDIYAYSNYQAIESLLPKTYPIEISPVEDLVFDWTIDGQSIDATETVQDPAGEVVPYPIHRDPVILIPSYNEHEYQYFWNFGDTTFTQSYPGSAYGDAQTHEYDIAGVYPISFTAVDYLGESITVNMDLIVEQANKILANLNVTVNGPQVFLSADTSFNFQPLIAIPLIYTWDFGDGTVYSTDTIDHAQHVYSALGNYAIHLTIRSEDNSLTRTVSTPVSIVELYVPYIYVH